MSDKPKTFEVSIEQQLTNLVGKHAFIDKADEHFSSDCIGLMRKGAIAILDGIGFYARDEKIKAMQAEIDKRDAVIKSCTSVLETLLELGFNENFIRNELKLIEKELTQGNKDE